MFLAEWIIPNIYKSSSDMLSKYPKVAMSTVSRKFFQVTGTFIKIFKLACIYYMDLKFYQEF